MWVRVVLLSLILVSALPTAASSEALPAANGAASQPQLCLGQVATLIGAPGQDLIRGTKGPDVIVTNGADEVDARDGDDLICATGRAGDYGSVTISLGPGADRLLGSPKDAELVFAGDEAPGEVDRDIIHTRGGSDTVWTGSDVTGAGVGEDIVALGGGFDLLKVTGPVSASTLLGGSGRDEILLWAKRPPGAAVTIDNRREELSLDEEVVMSWHSFQNFTAFGYIEGPLTFRGASIPERLGNGVFFMDDQWKVDVRMGGGRDKVLISGGAHGGRFEGGRGADTIRNDDFGAAENDGPGVVIYGRSGDDRLFGSGGDDVLIGGRGYDVVEGGGGFDRCTAELRTDCES